MKTIHIYILIFINKLMVSILIYRYESTWFRYLMSPRWTMWFQNICYGINLAPTSSLLGCGREQRQRRRRRSRDKEKEEDTRWWMRNYCCCVAKWQHMLGCQLMLAHCQDQALEGCVVKCHSLTLCSPVRIKQEISRLSTQIHHSNIYLGAFPFK